jgi:YesN/AraC family two-component response regulator
MSYLGINTEEFNPQILYIFKADNKNGYTGKYHSHDFLEISYILSGSSTYNVENTKFQAKKGDLFLFNPGVYHNEIANINTSELHIGFNKVMLNGLPANFMLPTSASSLVKLVKYEAEFISCVNQIILEQERQEPGYELVLKTLVMRLIIILLRELHREEGGTYNYKCSFESSEKANIVHTITSYMKEHYNEQISLDKIAKNTYLSPIYISKIFKEETGDSPINYLINIRLNRAKELLEEGQLSIKAIAKFVGYEDAYYFSKLFKKHFGIPPSKIKP